MTEIIKYYPFLDRKTAISAKVNIILICVISSKIIVVEEDESEFGCSADDCIEGDAER